MSEVNIFYNEPTVGHTTYTNVVRVEVDGEVVWERPKFKVGDWVYSNTSQAYTGRFGIVRDILGISTLPVGVQFDYNGGIVRYREDELERVPND